MILERKDVFPNINCTHCTESDIDLQSRPSEGPNTSSVWIWRKSVQWFRRYFIHKQKSRTQRQKQNLTQFTECGKNTQNTYTKHAAAIGSVRPSSTSV